MAEAVSMPLQRFTGKNLNRFEQRSVTVSSLGRAPLALVALCAMLLGIPTSGLAQEDAFVSRGLRLHYQTIGTGTPVIILSGGPGIDVDYMQPVAAAFSGFRRILLEQRGTGRSISDTLRAEDMTLSVVVEDLEALREHLRQERLFLVGHSWGGMLAMAYAAAHPGRVDRLVLIASGGPTMEFSTWFEDNIRSRLRPEDLEAEQYWMAAEKRGVDADKVALESARALAPGYFFDRGKALAYAATMPDGSLHAAPNALLFADLAKSYDLRAGLRRLERPTLILHGHQDPMGDKTAEDIHTLIKSSTLVYLDKCGHFPWVEQPAAFEQAIQSFLAAAAPQRQ